MPQCGYCINGWILTAAALLKTNPHPSDGEIRAALAGLKCRCGTHLGLLRAVKRAASAAWAEADMSAPLRLPPRSAERRRRLRHRVFRGALNWSWPKPRRLRSIRRKVPIPWIAIKQDGSVIAYFGKVDMGQGLDVGIAHIVADELDVSFARVGVAWGDTATSVNQGGASGSTGIQRGGVTLRNAAAEARRLLLGMAATKLDVPFDKLSVDDGVVSDGPRQISYGELIGAKQFHAVLDWNGKIGNELVASGKAAPKSPRDYKIVGRTFPRADIAAKVFAKLDYVTDIKLPGMVHGRMPIRPPGRGRGSSRDRRNLDEENSGRPSRLEAGFCRRCRGPRVGCDPRRQATQHHVVATALAIPEASTTLRASISATRRSAPTRWSARTARSRRRWRARPKSSMPNMNGHSNRIPAWDRPAP